MSDNVNLLSNAPVPDLDMPKIARWSRGWIITEKIDGLCARIRISEDGRTLRAGGKGSWWSTPEEKGATWKKAKDDPYGFARWVGDHRDELLKLGPGTHFGEWWGPGTGRPNYGLTEKRWSLFNVRRWSIDYNGENDAATLPACCNVVPLLWQGTTADIDERIRAMMLHLYQLGSHAAPGQKAEGIVIYHVSGNLLFKKTFAHDESGKGTPES